MEQPLKERQGSKRGILCKKGMRQGLLLAVLLTAGMATAQAADYVFKTAGGYYIGMNAAGDDIELKTSLDSTCIWRCYNGTTASELSSSNNTRRSLSNFMFPSMYLTCTNANTPVLGAGAQSAVWKINNNFLAYQSANNQTVYYIKWNGSAMSRSNNNNSNGFAVYQINSTDGISVSQTEQGTTNYPAETTTTLSGASVITTSGNYNYTASGTTLSAYTVSHMRKTTILNYSDNTSESFYYDYDVASARSVSSLDFSDGWTVTWSMPSNSYATITSAGVLTVSTIPTTQVTLTLTFEATKTGEPTQSGTKSVVLIAAEAVEGGTTGVSGGVVTLNDYEPHEWSYYSDPLCPIHSLNPVNVKITYNGNGTGTVSNGNEGGNAPTAAQLTNDALTVLIGVDAPCSTLVYYKTLEREGGDDPTLTAVNQSTGRCAYRLIPNPFSVRPTVGTDNGRWRGFHGWRVKSKSDGLTIYRTATENTTYGVGDIIPITGSEPTVYFQTTNEYGESVEFEAIWARAYVTTGYNATGLNASSYERNFVVLTGTEGLNSALGKPATVMSIYPNGTSNGTGALASSSTASQHTLSGITLSNDMKMEYITLTGTNDISAGGTHYLCFGRGISTANTAAGQIAGRINNGEINYTLRIESGTIRGPFFFAVNNGANIGNTYSVYTCVIFGNDYDRASNGGAGNNDNLILCNTTQAGNNNDGTNNRMLQAYNAFKNPALINARTLDCLVLSGKMHTGITGNQARYNSGIYLGQTSGDSSNYCGERYLTVLGGELLNILGGRGAGQRTYADITTKAVNIRFMKGTVNGSIVGGAANSMSYGSRRIVVTGGTIKGWICGGANGTGSNNAVTTGNSYIYVGGNATVGGSEVQSVYNTMGGNVFGAGRGESNQQASVRNSTVVVADNAEISYNVYGGGNYGRATVGSDIHVLGGTVEGGVFGGANMATGVVVGMTMRGGLVKGGLFGGSNTSGTVTGPVTMSVIGGQVGTNATTTGLVCGGGFGSATYVTGNINITVGATDSVITQPTIYGDVYGGSAMGLVNGTNTTTTPTSTHTYVTVDNGTITGEGTTATAKIAGDGTNTSQTFTTTGSVYGGGLGTTTPAHPANVWGSDVQVFVTGGTMNNTFGCNNTNGAPQGHVKTTITGGTIGNVYGGGNAAAYGDSNLGGGNMAAPHVLMKGGHVTGNVFGGGLGTSATVSEHSHVQIIGSSHVSGNVYGGGNAATVTGNTKVQIGGDE